MIQFYKIIPNLILKGFSDGLNQGRYNKRNGRKKYIHRVRNNKRQ